MAFFSHGPGTPFFISPNFSHARPPGIEAPDVASPMLYVLITVLVVLLLTGTAVLARWTTRRGRVHQPISQDPSQNLPLLSRP